MSPIDIQNVFAALDLTPIERGVEEIEKAKDRLMTAGKPEADQGLAYRIVVTNGTRNRTQETIRNAELERSPC